MVGKGEYQNAWYGLLKLHYYVEHNATVLDYGQLRTAVFLPFGGPGLWNRLTYLLIKEIEVANERNFGNELDAEGRLPREWALSGYTRSAVLGGERTKPLRYPDGPPDWGAVVGDQQDTSSL